jgi:hypothetical protein
MRELHRGAHFVVTVDDVSRLVRRTRTERRFESLEEAENAYEAALRALATVDQGRHAMLVDVRLAPARNDPAFEELLARVGARLFSGFRRVAILARTEAGRLQIGRVSARFHPSLRGFTDEAAALAYLADDRAPGARDPG